MPRSPASARPRGMRSLVPPWPARRTGHRRAPRLPLAAVPTTGAARKRLSRLLLPDERLDEAFRQVGAVVAGGVSPSGGGRVQSGARAVDGIADPSLPPARGGTAEAARGQLPELPRCLPPLPVGCEPPGHALDLLPQSLGLRAVLADRQGPPDGHAVCQDRRGPALSPRRGRPGHRDRSGTPSEAFPAGSLRRERDGGRTRSILRLQGTIHHPRQGPPARPWPTAAAHPSQQRAQNR